VCAYVVKILVEIITIVTRKGKDPVDVKIGVQQFTQAGAKKIASTVGNFQW